MSLALVRGDETGVARVRVAFWHLRFFQTVAEDRLAMCQQPSGRATVPPGAGPLHVCEAGYHERSSLYGSMW